MKIHIFLLFLLYQQIQADLYRPFWKSKPEVLKKMLNEGLIVVSADTKERKTEKLKYHLNVVAGGVVNSKLSFVDGVVRDFENLKNVDERFQEVKYDKSKNQLYLHLVTLGFHARMYLNLKESKTDKYVVWDWVCVEGSFTGMKGSIKLEEIQRHRVEISSLADFYSDSIPLPKVLLGFGLEVIGRQVAEKMRSYIHDQAKKQGFYYNES